MLLTVSNISKEYPGNELFSGVSFLVDKGEKVAITGNNGCGKSTLLKIIVGDETPDTGDIQFAKDTSFGYLSQYQEEDASCNIYDYVIGARPEILEAEERLAQMEEQMALLSENEIHSHMESYEKRRHIFSAMGGDSYRSEAVGVLKGLGFSEDEFSKDVSKLSGGQKTRAALSRLLLKKPDILFLDEPINHLDIAAIEWLEGFLKNYQGAVIIVAHDRYFLDRVVSRILDLSEHGIRDYKGNYTEFVRQKEIYLVARNSEYEKQQKKIAHEKAVIEKLRRFNREKSIKRAESRVKKLDKIELIEKPVEENDSMSLSLSSGKRSGEDVLDITGLSKSYSDRSLFSDIDIHITRGERVALIGENGIGKSTILKIINGQVPADSGTVMIGANVSIGYYDQEQQLFDDSKTLFQEMSDSYPGLDNTKIRNVLAAFLFTGDDVFKRIGDLSGGERGRISLAKLMLRSANLLILDEPTNHLDMQSKEILENALSIYDGTIFFVSHDRYFVNSVADRILELTSRGLRVFYGNYDYYLSKRDEIGSTVSDSDTSDTVSESESGSVDQSAGRLSWEESKRIEAEKRKKEKQLLAVEERIGELEEEKDSITEKMSLPENATNSAKLNEFGERLSLIDEELSGLYDEWESLSE